MKIIQTKKIVPYTPDKMYALVNDIEAYPEFLPWCQASTVHNRTEEEVKATLVLSSHGFTHSITTHNRMQLNKMIEVRLLEGPLKHLEGFWRFEPIDEQQCEITFDIQFEFSNPLLRMVLEPFFNQIADTMVDAFSSRAEKLYNPS